jgi:hypothetical protein
MWRPTEWLCKIFLQLLLLLLLLLVPLLLVLQPGPAP